MKICKPILTILLFLSIEVFIAFTVSSVFASTSSEVVELNNDDESFSENDPASDPMPEPTPSPTPEPTPGISQETQEFYDDILTYIATDKKTMTEILVSMWALFGLIVGLHIVKDTMG